MAVCFGLGPTVAQAWGAARSSQDEPGELEIPCRATQVQRQTSVKNAVGTHSGVLETRSSGQIHNHALPRLSLGSSMVRGRL